MISELDRLRLEQAPPKVETGMVMLIGPLGTCVGIYTRAHAEEILLERTDKHGVCMWSVLEL